MSAALRQQRRRERLRRGLVVLTLQLDEARLEDMLRSADLLAPNEEGPHALARALEEQVELLCRLAEACHG